MAGTIGRSNVIASKITGGLLQHRGGRPRWSAETKRNALNLKVVRKGASCPQAVALSPVTDPEFVRVGVDPSVPAFTFVVCTLSGLASESCPRSPPAA